MRVLSIVLIGLFSLFVGMSCKDKSAEEQELENMHKQVMAVHDEVMPKISEINRMSRQLSGKLEGLAAEAQKNQVQTLINSLENADEGMMNWMYEFKKPAYSDFEAAKSYYENEMVKIAAVRDSMLTSIEKAQKYLEQ